MRSYFRKTDEDRVFVVIDAPKGFLPKDSVKIRATKSLLKDAKLGILVKTYRILSDGRLGLL